MTDSTDPGRRGLIAGSAAALAAAAAAAVIGNASEGQSSPMAIQVWEHEACGGCGAAVYFLPGQRANTCAQPGCGTRVVRG